MTFAAASHRGILTGILTGALALTIAPPGQGRSADVIVRGTDLDAVIAAVTERGGDIELEIGIIDAVAAEVPAGLLADLSADPRVTEVTADAAIELASHKDGHADAQKGPQEPKPAKDPKPAQDPKPAKDPKPPKGETSPPADEPTPAPAPDENEELADGHRGMTPDEASHRLGGAAMDEIGQFDGDGIDVAVIDSGVAPNKALPATRIDHGINVSFDQGGPLDGYGHGTAMATIIAGDSAAYQGVGSHSRIVDVKVADRNGMADISQVLAGIDWAVTNRTTGGRNIRVMSLSFGTDGTNGYDTSPLAYAVEAAWRHGIVVVVSAGNHGDALGRLTSPAIDPFVIAVGAADLTNVTGPSDLDNTVVPNWSGRGDGVRNPDVVAPGRSLLASRVLKSKLDESNISAREGDFLLGSGTSQATAFTAGVVTAMLEARPSLNPDQVKTLLTTTAHDLRDVPTTADGAGVLNLGALFPGGALIATPHRTMQHHAWSDGSGSLDGDRGSYVLQDKAGNRLTGENTVFGVFDHDAWTGSTWSGSTWSGSTWSGSTWSGSTWSGSTWSGSTWSGSTWSGSTWSGSTWSGSTWSGSTWSGSTWSNVIWGS